MPKSLVEKITDVFKNLPIVLKEGDNGEYAYLRIVDISNILRERLCESGILIIPCDLGCELRRIDSPITDREYTEATVHTRFTITDGIQSLDYTSYGFARDMDAKCVAIAQTSALKSFLKRLALIFGNLDDPEVEQPTEHSLNLEEGEKEWGSNIQEWPISRGQVIAFNSACQASGYSKKGIAQYLEGTYGIDKPSDLRRKYLAQAMMWATASGEKPENAVGNEPS